MKSAAEPVDFRRFTVSLGLVVLFAVLLKTMASDYGLAEFVDVSRMTRLFFLVRIAGKALQERLVGLAPVLILGVILSGMLTAALSHLATLPPID